MSILGTIGRVVSGIATGGISEIARVAAIAAGKHKEVRTAESIVGASTIEFAKGALGGLVIGGPTGALAGGVIGAAGTTAQLAAQAIRGQRRTPITPAVRVQIAQRQSPSVPTRQTGGGLFPPAFASFIPAPATGGNPAWLFLEQAAGSSQRCYRGSGACSGVR